MNPVGFVGWRLVETMPRFEARGAMIIIYKVASWCKRQRPQTSVTYCLDSAVCTEV